MKKFKFRLEPLLKLRRMNEKQKKRVVGTLIGEINEQQRQALEMADAIKQQGELLTRRQAQNNVDLSWVGHYQNYVMYTQQAIAERIQRVSQIQQRLNVARQELAEAAKQTKILDKLKEKRLGRYEHELARMEARQQDEISTNIFLRESKKSRDLIAS